METIDVSSVDVNAVAVGDLNLLSLVIVGAIISGIVQVLKKSVGSSGWKSVSIVTLISFVVGAGYWFLKDYGFWDTFLQILVYANAVYALLIKQLVK